MDIDLVFKIAAVGILVSAAISLCDKHTLAKRTTGEKVSS